MAGIGDLASLVGIVAILFGAIAAMIALATRALNIKIDSSTDTVNHKIDSIRRDMDGLISRVERNANEKIHELDRKLDEHRGLLFNYQTSIKDSCTQLMERMGSLRASIDAFPDLYCKREELSKLQAEIEILEKKMQSIEKH